jgi:hypothetical protein
VAKLSGGRLRWAALAAQLGEIPLVILVAVGLMARVVADLAFPAPGVNLYEFGVIAKNIDMGRGFAYFAATPSGVVIDIAHTGVPLPSAFMPPLYTGAVFVGMAGARLIDGGPDAAVWFLRIVNLGFAAVTMVGLARLVGLVASARAARLAVLGFAVYPTFVYQATQASASNAYLAVEVWLIALCAALVKRVGIGRLLAAGLLAGLLGLLRAEAGLLVVAVAVWLTWFAGAEQLRFRRRLVVGATFLGVALLLPGGWLLRNSMLFDRPVITSTTTGGFNLWIGNHPGATGSQKDYAVPDSLAVRISTVHPSTNYELDRDAVFAEAAREEIVANPIDIILRDGKKLLMMLGVDPYDDRSRHPVYIVAYGMLVAGGVSGAVAWWRDKGGAKRNDRRAYATLLGGWVVLSLAVPSVFFALARYRLPLELVLVVGSAILLAQVGEASRDITTGSDSGSNPILGSGSLVGQRRSAR